MLILLTDRLIILWMPLVRIHDNFHHVMILFLFSLSGYLAMHSYCWEKLALHHNERVVEWPISNWWSVSPNVVGLWLSNPIGHFRGTLCLDWKHSFSRCLYTFMSMLIKLVFMHQMLYTKPKFFAADLTTLDVLESVQECWLSCLIGR